MMPSLEDQERIFVNKFVYRLEPIERGDIVVFRYPRDPSKSYIKRVIGMAGDRIRIDGGQVYVNDRSLDEDYVPPAYTDSRSYPEMVVPENSYFVLGDHRSMSNDAAILVQSTELHLRQGGRWVLAVDKARTRALASKSPNSFKPPFSYLIRLSDDEARSHARAFAIYLVVLLAAGRCTVTAQSSSSPESRNDGLITAAPESVGVAAKPLHDMDAAVRAGEFKKIGSVLVARHGKLVFEDYFDGDAGTLRDTRSATKSITDMLVGIAISEAGGVDARVLVLPNGREDAESRSA
jgi:signal peptidase I